MAADLEIPTTWRRVEIGDVAKVEYGKAKPKAEGPYPAIGSGGEFARVSDALVDPPAIVIGRKGTAGQVWLIREPCWPSDTTFYLDWTSEVDVEFVHAALVANPISSVQGDVLPSLKRPDLAATSILLPPLSEQRAIAHVLRTVQRAKEATEQVISAAQELKKSLMRHLFSNGPRSRTGEVPSLVDTEFGPIPAHWRTSLLSECAVIQSGATKGRRIGGDGALEVPYLRVANVQDGFLDLREIKTITIKASELDRFALRTGDILLTEGGDFDKLGRGHIWRGQIDPCVHQNHIFAVRPDPDRALPEFVSYLMQSPYAKRYFLKVAHRTTNLASINKAKLGRFPMLLPPFDEQEEVVRALTSVDQKIAAEEVRRDALVTLFDSLLHDLMTARLRVAGLEVLA